MKIAINPAIGIVLAGLAWSSAAAAQAPAVHFSTFEKQASACACHLFARSAMTNHGLHIIEDAGSAILASNNSVVVEAICLPDQRHIRLSAFSADSHAAEMARNDIRASIVNARLLDTCP